MHESKNCYISPMNVLYMERCIRCKSQVCDLRDVIDDDQKDK